MPKPITPEGVRAEYAIATPAGAWMPGHARPSSRYQWLRKRSASIAAMQPVPAAVTA